MITTPFQQQFTWRKLGYLFYGSSLEYRSVLEDNPQWEVFQLPPVGAQIVLPNPTSTSGLDQSSFLYGVGDPATQDEIYPFNSENDYLVSLDRYSISAINQRSSINGITSDSVEAFTGLQGKT